MKNRKNENSKIVKNISYLIWDGVSIYQRGPVATNKERRRN